MIIQLLKYEGICLSVILLICIGSLIAPVIYYYIRKIFGNDSETTYIYAEGYCDPNNNSGSHAEGQGISDNYTHAEGYYSKETNKNFAVEEVIDALRERDENNVK